MDDLIEKLVIKKISKRSHWNKLTLVKRLIKTQSQKCYFSLCMCALCMWVYLFECCRQSTCFRWLFVCACLHFYKSLLFRFPLWMVAYGRGMKLWQTKFSYNFILTKSDCIKNEKYCTDTAKRSEISLYKM